MKRVLILLLALTTVAVARDKKPKAQPGPYVFTSKASAQTIRTLIVQDNVNDGYALDSDHPLQLRFSKPGQMPVIGALFMASSACPGMTTKQVWSYTLAEIDSATKVTVEPAWEYPDDYCQTQTHELIWNKPEEIAAFQAMLDKAPASVAQAGTTSTPVPPKVAPAPVPAAVAYPQQLAPATQSPAHGGSPDENSESAAQHAKQHAACLELAKDNPSIVCK